MKLTKLAPLSILALAAFTGCSSGTEYEVTGEVTSAQAAAGTIVVEFFEELTPEGATEAERTSVHSVELTALGALANEAGFGTGGVVSGPGPVESRAAISAAMDSPIL